MSDGLKHRPPDVLLSVLLDFCWLAVILMTFQRIGVNRVVCHQSCDLCLLQWTVGLTETVILGKKLSIFNEVKIINCDGFGIDIYFHS